MVPGNASANAPRRCGVSRANTANGPGCSGFYTGLIRKLCYEFNLPHPDGRSLGLPSAAAAAPGVAPRPAPTAGGSPQYEARPRRARRGMLSCHRCLVYLGDVARYRELHRDGGGEGKDWGGAARYYHLALRLLPAQGAPHNQLAVLATYTEDDLEALCASPQRTCREWVS